MSTRKLERDLYLASRTLGDVRVAKRGPAPLIKRVVRRDIHRTILRQLKSWKVW